MQSNSNSCLYAGGCVGARMLRLGKLQSRIAEEFVIEASPLSRGYQPAPFTDVTTSPNTKVSDVHALPNFDAVDQPIVEDDLNLEDFCSGDEGHDAVLQVDVFLPGSRRPRQLMEARSKQCVICLADKEHTFVPTHRDLPSQQVEGHRICTDCWANFLYHGLRQRSSNGRGPPPLACPLCRGTIDVPDAWATFMELPPSWQDKAAGNEPIPCLSLCTPRASMDRQVWWQRPGSSSADSDASEGESTINEESTRRTVTRENGLVGHGIRCLSNRFLMCGSLNCAAAAEASCSSQDSSSNADYNRHEIAYT